MTHSASKTARGAGKRGQFAAVLITVVAFVLLSKLAWWQWQRAAEKTQQLAQIASWQQQEGVPFPQLIAAELARFDGAPLQGEAFWVAPHLWLVDNQIFNGVVGYDVLIPVRAKHGSLILLVNLGWTAGTADRTTLPAVKVPASFELDGVLRYAPRPFVLGHSVELRLDYPQRVQAIVPADLAVASGLPVADAVFYQQNSPFQPHYRPVVMPPEKHRAYAVQWALLAVAVVFVAVAVRYQKERR